MSSLSMPLGVFLFKHVGTALLPPETTVKTPSSSAHGTGEATANNNNNNSATPTSWEDVDYYECLGLADATTTDAVKRKITWEEIRRAYKAKSLALHPDKWAARLLQQQQQSDGSAHESMRQELTARYQAVQEAYSVLSDPEQRALYHAWGCHPGRTRFIRSGQYMHPAALLNNLQQASFCDKTRLVILLVVIFGLIWLQPILLAAKINQWVDRTPDSDSITWALVLLPFWIFYGLYLLVLFATYILLVRVSAVRRQERKKWAQYHQEDNEAAYLLHESWPRRFALATFCEHACWMTGIILLVRHWDGDRDTRWSTWAKTSIPFYVGIFCRMVATVLQYRQVQGIMEQLISPERWETLLERPMPTPLASSAASALEEDTGASPEAWQAYLASRYTVVTVNVEAVSVAVKALEEQRKQQQPSPTGNNPNDSQATSSTGDVTEEEMEAIKIQLSPEYHALEKSVQELSGRMTRITFCWIPQLALISVKLQGKLHRASWWVIFLPLLISLGTQWIRSLCMSCCSVTTGDEVVMLAPTTADAPEPPSDDQPSTAPTAKPTTGTSRPGRQKESQSDQGRPMGSMRWAPTEGDISMFQLGDPKNDGKLGGSPPTSQDNLDEELKVDMSSAKVITQDGPGANPGQGEEGRDEVDVEAGEGDQPHIHLDEETFHAWKAAQEQAEQSAMEKQAQGQAMCCWLSLELITVCLIIGKLDQDYQNHDEGSFGYNTYWILFPLLIVAGLVLCCCCCLIYGAGAESLLERWEEGARNDSGPTGPGDHPGGAHLSTAQPDAAPLATPSENPTSWPSTSRVGDVEHQAAPADIANHEVAGDINDLD